jgi:hypothetical protein
MDTVRPAELVEAGQVFFSLGESDWKEIAKALKQLSNNTVYEGCAATMAGYTKISKKPSEKQARILAKSLILVRQKGKCSGVISKIPPDSWKVLQEIGS